MPRTSLTATLASLLLTLGSLPATNLAQPPVAQAPRPSAGLAEAERLNRQVIQLYRQGKYAEAIPLAERVLQISETELGPSHPDTATNLNNLAGLYQAQGRYAEAEPLYQRALKIRETELGPSHPDTATSLNNLAGLYQAQGRYAEAEPLYQRALKISETELGPSHPNTATSLNNLAGLYQAQGQTNLAVSYLQRGLAIEERNLDLNLAIGAEGQKQDYMRTISGTTNGAISLHLQAASNNPAAARLAFTTLLQRKGRIFDALASTQQVLRQQLDPETQKLFDQLRQAQTQLANLVYGGLGNRTPDAYHQEIAKLEAQVRELEAQLNTRSAAFRQANQPVTLEAVQQQIPADAALVEIVQYQPFDFKARQGERFGSQRYAAYVLLATGEPRWADLGPVAEVEPLLQRFQEGITNEDIWGDELQRRAQALEAKLMAPVRSLTGDKRQILLSLDGELNRIPFAALVDPQGRYLLENYTITYLSSGRDLLRLSEAIPSQSPPLVVANPDYSSATATLTAAPTGQLDLNRGRRSVNWSAVNQFSQLPYSEREGEAIAPLLAQAQLLIGPQATEAAVKGAQAPKILHLATHGFFLPNNPARRPEAAGLAESRPTGPNPENPLLRSGLVFAGANQRQTQNNQGEDGILTALEVTGLNLRGTQLVVLSACDTGKGDIQTGEGVYGLRRAFALAGAESLVFTLWAVDDEVTQRMMVEYYRRLAAGEGRSEAMRQVQLKVLSSNRNFSHPRYWAAFMPSGQWAAISPGVLTRVN